jgi:hypothetical protein
MLIAASTSDDARTEHNSMISDSDKFKSLEILYLVVNLSVFFTLLKD